MWSWVEKLIKKRVNLENVHEKVEETRDVIADVKGGNLFLTKNSVCLGHNVDFMLDDAAGAENRISKTKNMSDLKFIWEEREVPLTAKIKPCQDVPMSLMIWVS